MGYAGSAQRHEPIGRASLPTAAFTLSEVQYFLQDETRKLSFKCRPLFCTMSVDSCRAQFERGLSSCRGCQVGKAHCTGVTPKLVRAEPGVAVYAQPQSCIRCGRAGSDPHSERFVGRFRTVGRASRFLEGGSRLTTTCINCFNRSQEIVVGRNSKGAQPKKHAVLRGATISYTVGEKKYFNVDIGLRSGVPEIRRLLKRAYEGAKLKLIQVRFNGDVVNLKSNDDPLWVADKPAKQKTRTSTVASGPKPAAQSPACAAALGNPAPVAKKRGRRATNPIEQAEYAESLLSMIRDAQRDPYGMRDLAQWLLEGVTRGPWRYTPPGSKTAVPSAPVAATVASPEVAESNVQTAFHGNVIDLTGQRYGLLTAIAHHGKDRFGRSIWRWLCDCGEEAAISARNVKSGNTISCGCFKDTSIRQKSQEGGPLAEHEIAEWRDIVGDAVEPSAPVSQNTTPVDAAEPVSDDSEQPGEQHIEPGEWDGVAICGTDGGQHILTDLAAARGVDPEVIAGELNMIEDEPAPESEPVAQPAPTKPTPAPKKLSGKALRKKQKREAREARATERAARRIPATKPAPLAATCKAFVQVMFERGMRK